jgi:hypothetical protein
MSDDDIIIDADLLNRYLLKDCNLQEQRAVEVWLEKNEDFPDHAISNDAIWNVLPKDEVKQNIRRGITTSGAKISIVRYWYAAASVLLLIAAVSFLWQHFIRKREILVRLIIMLHI